MRTRKNRDQKAEEVMELQPELVSAAGPVTQDAVIQLLAEEESSGRPVVGGWMERVERIVSELEGD